LLVGNVQPYFLTQADVALDKSKPLPQQPNLAAIEDQALTVGEVFAGFISAATTSLDIAIYDFRLLDGALTDKIVQAVQAAAERGVSVRLAYDRTQAAGAILKAFADAGGDPAPVGTHTFVATAALPAGVQVRPIQEEAIDPVGLDYWIWPGRPGGLGSSLSNPRGGRGTHGSVLRRPAGHARRDRIANRARGPRTPSG
jgi:hypothetical protein